MGPRTARAQKIQRAESLWGQFGDSWVLVWGAAENLATDGESALVTQKSKARFTDSGANLVVLAPGQCTTFAERHGPHRNHYGAKAPGVVAFVLLNMQAESRCCLRLKGSSFGAFDTQQEP